MNVQQLNSSGQQIRVVILTALISFFFTGLLWWTVVRVNNARQWLLTGEFVKNKYGEPNYSFGVRLAMLCYFIFHQQAPHGGHGVPKSNRWVFRSNAWGHILINSQRRFDVQYWDDGTEAKEARDHGNGRAAGHFAAHCVKRGIRHRDWFEHVKWEPLWSLSTLTKARRHPESSVAAASVVLGDRGSG